MFKLTSVNNILFIFFTSLNIYNVMNKVVFIYDFFFNFFDPLSLSTFHIELPLLLNFYVFLYQHLIFLVYSIWNVWRSCQLADLVPVLFDKKHKLNRY
jgi:hypothetical protein